MKISRVTLGQARATLCLPPTPRHWAMSADILGCHDWGREEGAVGTQWEEIREADQHPTRHRAVHMLKNYLATNVYSVEAENPGLSDHVEGKTEPRRADSSAPAGLPSRLTAGPSHHWAGFTRTMHTHFLLSLSLC